MYIKNVRTDDTIIFQFGRFIYIMILNCSYLRIDIQELNNNECTESDGDDVCEGLVEVHHSS